MATRLPASQRTREDLTSLIEGRLSTSSARSPASWTTSKPASTSALAGDTSAGHPDHELT